jgi:hypothetical protein
MTTIEQKPAAEDAKKARAERRNNRIVALTSLFGLATAIVTLGVKLVEATADADKATSRANAYSAKVEQLQDNNDDLQRKLNEARRAIQASQSPSVTETPATPGTVYLSELQPVRGSFSPTEITVRGVPQTNAIASPFRCIFPYRWTAEYKIAQPKLTRFRATVMLDDEATEGLLMHYFVRINGEVVQSGDIKYGAPAKINKRVPEMTEVTVGFSTEHCYDLDGQGVYADARLSTS